MKPLPWIAMVPARAASTRLPGKALADIGGRPMVVRVAQQAQRSGAARVVVATDDVTIADTVEQYGIEAVMTSPDHPSGTDRLAEACSSLNVSDNTIVVNVQGDEPLIDPDLVGAVAKLLGDRTEVEVATAAHPIDSASTLFDSNAVKVVCNHRRLPSPASRPTGALRITGTATGTGKRVCDRSAHYQYPTRPGR